jgi:hypothetical protein
MVRSPVICLQGYNHNINNNATMTTMALLPMQTRTRGLFHFKVFLLLLGIIPHYNNIQEWSYLTRSAILLLCLTPWHHVMDHGNASSFLLMIGLTRQAFNALLDIIKPLGHPALPKKGPKWSLPPNAFCCFMLVAPWLSNIYACCLVLLLLSAHKF